MSGNARKTAIKKALKSYQKNVFSSVPFKKLEQYNPSTSNNSKADSTANISFVCFENFKVGLRSSVVESLFSKVTETSESCNSVQKSNTSMVSLLETLRRLLLTTVAGLQ